MHSIVPREVIAMGCRLQLIGLVSVLASTVLLSGCANLNSIYREFSTQDGSEKNKNKKGNSISLDVKQRVILSTQTEYGLVTCAEPSPDALSAFASSASLSGSNEGSKAVQAAIASSESAAYVGLRTQTIQLLRDGMYRICEGYMGGAISRSEFSSLQRRYQNLMMGLLAIEQLTGAVTPRPVALTTASAAGTGGDIQQEEEALSQAEKSKIDASANFLAAQKAVANQKIVSDSARAKADDLIAKSKKAPPEATENDVVRAKLEAATEANKLSDLEIDMGRKNQLEQLATTNVGQKRASLDAARLRVSAAENGSFAVSLHGRMDPVTSAELSKTVELIVKDVVSNSFIQDACLSFLTTQPLKVTSDSTSRKFSDAEESSMKTACLSVITESAALFKVNVERIKAESANK